jgi:HAL2 family 3'(2'),5'-bisphosphate nucleotidase
MSSFSFERQVAIAAVRKAAEYCQKVTLKAKTIKSDSSPVTIADFASQAIINHEISKAFPNDFIVGEEDSSLLKSDHSLMSSLLQLLDGFSKEQICSLIDRGNHCGGAVDRFWTLDPIDGTKGFLRGGQYAICLGLIENGVPQVSVMATPNLPFPDLQSKTLGTLFVAVRGHGAFQSCLFDNGKESSIQAGSNENFSRWTESFEPAHSAQNKSALILSRLGITAPSIRMDSQAKYGLIARGEAHVYLRIPTRPDYEENIWDHAIGSLLVTEAGGVVGDLDGNSLDFTRGRTLGKLSGIAAVNSRYTFDKVVGIHQQET